MSGPAAGEARGFFLLLKGLGLLSLDLLTLHGTLLAVCLLFFTPRIGAALLAVSLGAWAVLRAWEKRW